MKKNPEYVLQWIVGSDAADLFWICWYKHWLVGFVWTGPLNVVALFVPWTTSPTVFIYCECVCMCVWKGSGNRSCDQPPEWYMLTVSLFLPPGGVEVTSAAAPVQGSWMLDNRGIPLPPPAAWLQKGRPGLICVYIIKITWEYMDYNMFAMFTVFLN